VTGKAPGTPLNRYLSELLDRLRPPEALIMATAVLESDYRDWLAMVAQPTLLLQSREDAVVPRGAAEYMQRRIAGSRLELLEASGHFPFFDVPQAVVDHIRGFA
jgi:sigma-B regulation protein RsbQ